MTIPSTFEVYKIQCRLLTFTGIWPKEKLDTIYKIKALISWFFTLKLFTILLIQFIYDMKDLTKFSKTLYIMAAYVGFLVKLVTFTYQKRKFLNLINYLQDPLFTSYPKDLNHYMVKAIRRSVLLAKVYFVAIISLMVFYIIYPILDNKSLPFPLPYDLGKYKLIMFVSQIIGELYSAINHAYLDLTCICLMGFAAAQLDILAEKIVRSEENNTVLKDHVGLNDVENLKHCVEHHLAIVRVVDYIEDIFSLGVFSQYAISVIAFCNTIFAFVLLPFSSQRFMLGDYLFVALLQLFMYCWYGNKIVEKSLPIGEACYKSKWYLSNRKTQKYLFIVMERSKRPLRITAMKLSVLSLPSFVTILRWSYSFLTLMLNMYNRNPTK